MAGESVLAKLAVLITANSAQFTKELSKTNASIQNFVGGIKSLAGTVGIAFGVREVINFGFEISKLAGEAEGVRNAFIRLRNSSAILEQMKVATGNTVSELNLMKAAVQANNFQIPVENLAKLFQFATLRAQQTGQSVDYLVESIILGIGRKCLVGETLIKTKSGLKRIDEINNGEEVPTLSLTGDIIDGIIKAVHKNGLRDVYKVDLVNGYSITATDNHRLYTSSGYKMLMEFTDNTSLLTDRGFVKIKSISYSGKEYVYDVSIPETENFFANGIVSHNSPLILDNLGISAIRLREKLRGVSAEAATVGDVAKVVGDIATEELSNMAEFSDNAATKIQKLSSSWDNFKVSVGDAANSSGIFGGILQRLTDTLNLFGPASAQADYNFRRLAQLISEASRSSESVQNSVYAPTLEALKQLRKEIGTNLSPNLEQLAKDFNLTENEVSILYQKIVEVNTALSNQEKIIEDFKEFSKGYKNVSEAANAYKQRLYELIVSYQIQRAQFERLNKSSDDAYNTEVSNLTNQISLKKDAIKFVNDYINANANADKSIVKSSESAAKGVKKLNIEIEDFRVTAADVLEDTSKLFNEIDRRALEIPVDIEIEPETVNDDALIDSLREKRDKLLELQEAFSATFQGGIQDVLTGFAEDLGNAASGVGNFGENIIKAVAGFAAQFGKLLIVAGLGKIAFDKLKFSGVGAVFAGIALIAAAKAVSNHISSSSSATGGGGSVSSSSVNNRPSASDQVATIQIVGESRIQGDMIVTAYNRARSNRSSIISNG